MSGDKVPLERILYEIEKRFAGAGIVSARLDARLLLEHVTGLDHAGIVLQGDQVLADKDKAQLEKLSQRRLAGEPIAKIIGEKEFYGRAFHVSADVLDPRPDTETLIDVAVRLFDRDRSLRILDLGTGSGVIAITLLHHFRNARAIATDISLKALAIAERNRQHHQMSDRLVLQQASWFEGIEGQFDLIVSNPPYVRRGEIGKLDRDVREYDPVLALDGGQDGLDIYRLLAAQCLAFLPQKGVICVETGFDQADEVAALFEAKGLRPHTGVDKVTRDLSGNDRIVTLMRAE